MTVKQTAVADRGARMLAPGARSTSTIAGPGWQTPADRQRPAAVDELAGFLRAGVARGESVLVGLPLEDAAALRPALGADVARVAFLDMVAAASDPAGVVSALRGSVSPSRGRGLRWIGGSDAFGDVAHAPQPADRRRPADSGRAGPARFAAATASAPPRAMTRRFGSSDLRALRHQVLQWCRASGVSRVVAEDLTLAAHEVAANSVVHAGGCGVLRCWVDPTGFVVEVQDAGRVEQTLADGRAERRAEEPGLAYGRGLALVHALCDLVQLGSGQQGTVVRLHTWR